VIYAGSSRDLVCAACGESTAALVIFGRDLDEPVPVCGRRDCLTALRDRQIVPA
jgi:hypothetical protein